MGQRNPKAADKEPNHIHQQRKTPPILRYNHRSMAERKQRQHTQFKDLQSERDPDNRQTHHYTRREIFERNGKTAENDPNHITEKIHDCCGVFSGKSNFYAKSIHILA